MVDAGIDIDQVIEIDVDHEEIVSRMSGRRVHPGSGRVYHVTHNPPLLEGMDDVSGEPLIQRDDDTEETVRHRLSVYESQTRPLVDFYSNLEGPFYHQIDGIGSVEAVTQSIRDALGQ